jgi:AcrR family transcriptional regulator
MSARPEEPGTRDKILIAAATMLAENPTARLSVRAVAARARVSTGSLRHFFPTQRQLIDTVIAGLHELDIPDDPIHDHSRTPRDRLLACLQLLLAQVGAGEQARQHWRALYDAYVASPPGDDEAATYFALERTGRLRIERWLTVLVEEGAIPPVRTEQAGRFLTTVLNGLITERALPADALQVRTETETLRMAVHAATSAPVQESGPPT